MKERERVREREMMEREGEGEEREREREREREMDGDREMDMDTEDLKQIRPLLLMKLCRWGEGGGRAGKGLCLGKKKLLQIIF